MKMGQQLPIEVRKKISLTLKGIKHPDIAKKKMSESRKKLWRNKEYRERMRMVHLGKSISEETKQKLSLFHKGVSLENKYGKERARIILNKMKDALKRTNVSRRDKMIKHWQNIEHREKHMKLILKGLLKKPTSLEKQMIDFIQKYNLPYKYVGDGEFILGGKNPDFININGKKICIEVRPKKMCQIWNKCSPEEYEKERNEHFAKYGFKTLVLWWEDFFIDKQGKKKYIANENNILNKLEELDKRFGM